MRFEILLCSLFAGAIVAWTMIEEFPLATGVVAAIGAVVWWRIRRNDDRAPVPEARVVRPDERDGGDQSQPM